MITLSNSETILYISFWAICYRLSEFKWWGKGNSWWMSRKNPFTYSSFHKYTFKFFYDSYHFFGNLPRIVFSLRIAYDDIFLGILCFTVWYATEKTTKTFLLQLNEEIRHLTIQFFLILSIIATVLFYTAILVYGLSSASSYITALIWMIVRFYYPTLIC